MRRELLLAEPVPHPLLCSLPTPLLRVLLRETPSVFRALLWGRPDTPPAPSAALLDRVTSLSLEDELRRLVALARTAPRRTERHRAARLSRVLRRFVDRGHDASRLFLASVPIHEEALLADLPAGAHLIRLQREVEEANRTFAEGVAGRLRLRRSVFALVRAARAFLDRYLHHRRGSRRVDFSGRAPLVPDPSLALDQCRLPISMAFELFQLHLVGELVRLRMAATPAEARRRVIARPPALIPLLQAISVHHPIIVSAGEGLSRHHVQAYFPVLSSEDAVGLSPMAIRRLAGDDILSVKVFLPLGERAQEDACQRMTSPATLVEPGSPRPRLGLSADAQIGLYLAGIERIGQKGQSPFPDPAEDWAAIRAGQSIPHGPGLGPADREKRRRLRQLQQAHVYRFGALRGFFASVAEVRRAVEANELSSNAPIFVRCGSKTLSTVAGRCLLMDLFPPDLSCDLANTDLDAKAIERILAVSVDVLGGRRAAALAEAAEALGLRLVTARGVSLCLDDIVVPARKEAVLGRGWASTKAILAEYEDGMLTDGERYNKIIDVWSEVAEVLGDEARRAVGAENPLRLLASSGVRGSRHEMRTMAAMKGLVAKPDGQIMERPILESLREGLSPHACFMTAMDGRAKRIGDAHRARANERVAKVLVEALGDVRITAQDCGALGALPVRALVDRGEVVRTLADQARGRVLAGTGRTLSAEEIDRLDDDDPREVAVRSPVFCEAKGGICASCYGLEPGTGALPELFAPVGLHAAHALASGLANIGLRPFHIGGGGYPSYVWTRRSGAVVVDPCDEAAIAVLPDGTRVIMARSVQIAILDDQGLTIPCGSARRGAVLRVAPGARVSGVTTLAEWDPYAIPSCAEHDGVVRWVDLVPGITVRERVDEVTGLARWIVEQPAGVDRTPRLSIVGDDGALRQAILLGRHHVIVAGDGERVHRGMTVAKRPVDPHSVSHLYVGRAEMLMLLRARTERPAVICEIAGVAQVRREAERRTITVIPDIGDPAVHHVELGHDICVQGGDPVEPGDCLSGGGWDPREVVRVFGPEAGATQIVAYLQLVYATFGMRLDARHAELVARAMLRWVRITSPGDGPWVSGELVDRARFERACEGLVGEGLAPPSGALTPAALAVRGAR